MQSQAATHNLPKLRIDNVKPRFVTCLWLFFFLLVGALFLLVLAIPDSVFTSQYFFIAQSMLDRSPVNSFFEKPFDIYDSPQLAIYMGGLDKKNQFFTIDLNPTQNSSSTELGKSHQYNLNFKLSVFGLNDDLSIAKTFKDDIFHSLTIQCDQNVGGQFNCRNRTIVYVNQIKEDNYLIVLTLTNQAELQGDISNFKAFITTINPKFTTFLLSLRYVCLGLTIIANLLYYMSLRKMRGEKLVFEQKFIRLLGYLLIFFNDPIYASTVLVPNIASACISAIFVITFISALLLFWICAFQRIYRENAQVKTRVISFQKTIYIFFLWAFSCSAYCVLAKMYLSDPTTDFEDEHAAKFLALKIIMLILVALGLLWMLYGIYNIYKKWRSIIWRHKVFFSFSIYFIFCYFVCMFTGSVSIYNVNGTQVILFFGITNVYIWFLMALYGPTQRGFAGSDEPIPLSQGIREFEGGYEHLDESSMREDQLGHVLRGTADKEQQNPDDIILQLGNDGEIISKNVNEQNRNPRTDAQKKYPYEENEEF